MQPPPGKAHVTIFAADVHRPHVGDVRIAGVFAALNWKRVPFHISASAAGYTDTDLHFTNWARYFNDVYLIIFALSPSLSLQDNRKECLYLIMTFFYIISCPQFYQCIFI